MRILSESWVGIARIRLLFLFIFCMNKLTVNAGATLLKGRAFLSARAATRTQKRGFSPNASPIAPAAKATAKLVAALIAGAPLLACTSVHIRSEAETTVHYYPGLVIVRIASTEHRPSVIETVGAGLTIGARSFTIGYSRELVAAWDGVDDCRVLFVLNNERDIERLQSVLQAGKMHLNEVCTLTPRGSNERH